MAKLFAESCYTDGVCGQRLQTCGATKVSWSVGEEGEYVQVDLGTYPSMASLVLIGPDADRLYAALGQALRERDLALLAEPPPVETGDGG